MRTCIVLALLLCTAIAYAESATQTDWSGGPGIYGPVSTWGDRFYISDAMDWDTEPGQLKLIVNRSENTIATPVTSPYYVIANDMDVDGDLDAAYCSYGTGAVYWSRNVNGLGTTWSHQTVGTLSQAQFVSVGDINDDGLRDIVASSADQNKVVWFRNNGGGGAWSMPITVAQNFDARQINCADIDGDGNQDVVGVSYESGDVVWWRNTNSGNTWAINYIDGALLGGYACDVGDFNNDGHPDIAAVSFSTGRVVAYFSQNPWGFSWAQHEVGTFTGARAVAVADVNDDGKLDIVVGSGSGNGSLRWYNHVSGTTWTMNSIEGTAPGLRSIDAADMDGDGSPDVIVACRDANRIYWFKNFLKLSQPWVRYDVSTYFAGARGVSVGDMNGDGVPDVMGCAETGNKISWWRIGGFNTPAILTSSILDVNPPVPGNNRWDYVAWSQVTPTGTSIKVRLRTSYSSSDMGPWSAWLTTGGSLAQVVAQGGRYIQYQTELATSNPNITPSLKDISIVWDPYSVGEGSVEPLDERLIWLPQGNPVSGAFTVSWSVPAGGSVNVTLFDSAGRAVRVLQSGEIQQGSYSAIVGGLPAGVYAVVMTGPDGIAAHRLTVIN